MTDPFDPRLLALLGDGDDSMPAVEARMQRAYPDLPLIVWEGDAQTFQFTHVSATAEALLGHPVTRWTSEPAFWTDHVVHPEDRDEAVGYCALATGARRDHCFEYRARAADGRVVWLHDYVKVILGARGIPVRLRGVMLDVSERKRAAGDFERAASARVPTTAQLNALTD